MARIVFALLVVNVAFAQATLLPAAGLSEVLPNPVLVLLLLWAALRGVVEGMAWVFGVGLLLDALALNALGTAGLALLPVALLAGPARRRFFHSGMVLPLALVVVATLAHALLLSLLRSVGHPEVALAPGAVLRVGFLQALLNALLVPPLYLVASRMDRWVTELERA
jgi:rod shape-determining protein MreD